MIWPAVDPELLRSLPPVLAAVVRALGFRRAREFLYMHGGVNVCLPKHTSAALGIEKDELLRLRETLAPHMNAQDRVWMPKPDKLWNRVRNADIQRQQYTQSISQQAREHNLSSRQIQNIRREADDRQMDLF